MQWRCEVRGLWKSDEGHTAVHMYGRIWHLNDPGVDDPESGWHPSLQGCKREAEERRAGRPAP